jgi:hypothetical protein
MKSTKSELVWTGITHLGDEPGIFSNANYTGLVFELPLTIKSSSGELQEVSFILKTELVKIFSGYKGHKVTITQFVLDNTSQNPYDYKEVILKEDYILDSNSDKIVTVNLKGNEIFLSCKVEIDTQVAPALYDDFLFTGIYFKSIDYKYFASLGFR